MMSLTVREKEHWKERIARRIDHAIEALQAKEDPSFRKRVAEQAEEDAWKSLGLVSLRKQREQIETDKKLLERELESVEAEMWARVTGEAVSDYANRSYYTRNAVREAVNQRKLVHERERLEEAPLGKEILRLENEKEELLDTVWLATSGKQIKELWSRFSELLNWQPPELQQKALAIEPDETDSN